MHTSHSGHLLCTQAAWVPDWSPVHRMVQVTVSCPLCHEALFSCKKLVLMPALPCCRSS